MTGRGTQQNRRTFAIGDVHGEVRLLMHMLELLAIGPKIRSCFSATAWTVVKTRSLP